MGGPTKKEKVSGAPPRVSGVRTFRTQIPSTSYPPMKKKSASRSAFFNLRVLIGIFMVLAGVFLPLLRSGAFSATAASIIQAMQKNKIITSSTDPLVPVGFDCSTIHEKGIDKQENFRAGAIMIAC